MTGFVSAAAARLVRAEAEAVAVMETERVITSIAVAPCNAIAKNLTFALD